MEYLDRAEYLKKVMTEKSQVKEVHSAEGASQQPRPTGKKDADGGKDEEKNRMQDGLSSAIVTEKPDVKVSTSLIEV